MKKKLNMKMTDVEELAKRTARRARVDEIKRVFYAKKDVDLPTEARLADVATEAYNRILRDYHDLCEPAL